MDPRPLHLRKGHDRPLQFAFKCAPVIHVLREIGQAEVGLIEDLETYAAGLWEPVPGESDPEFVYPGGGDEDRGFRSA